MENDFTLMQETVVSISDYLEKVVEGIKTLTEMIRNGREDKAVNMCIGLIDGLKWLTEALELTNPLQERYNIVVNTSDINEISLQVIEAFENRDYVMLGDVLEYELVPLMVDWHETVQILLSKIGDKNA